MTPGDRIRAAERLVLDLCLQRLREIRTNDPKGFAKIRTRPTADTATLLLCATESLELAMDDIPF